MKDSGNSNSAGNRPGSPADGSPRANPTIAEEDNNPAEMDYLSAIQQARRQGTK